MKLSAFVTTPARGLRRFVQMRFRRDTWRVLWTGRRGRVDYAKEVGDGLGSSTVAAPILWVARTFPEAPPKLWREDADGQEERIRDHPLLRLLQRPNPYFTGPVQWMATTTDWQVDGNAYWLKQRTRMGEVAQLWWTPSWMLTPKGTETTFITHYEYSVDGEVFSVKPEDVVHFRFGIDPDDPRKGYSPLKSVLREVFTDDEAAAFTASLLRNMGVPGLIVSPKNWEGAVPSQDEIDETKEYIKATFTGERRGEPLVLGGPTDVQAFGFSPEQLTLRELRRIPEERTTAVLGIPAIVAGLGAGLDRSTFTNMGEAREAAYEAGIIPMQRILAEEIRFQLLAEWLSDEEIWTTFFGFDLSKVRVLQEDLYRQQQRLDLAVRGGWAMVSEARRVAGYAVDEERDNVFLRPANVSEVRSDDGRIRSYAPARGGSNGNGNGASHYEPDEIADAVARSFERHALVVTK